MAITYGGAVSAAAKTVEDRAVSQATGAVCTGINFGLNDVAGAAAGVDNTDVGASRLGSGVTADLVVDDGTGA